MRSWLLTLVLLSYLSGTIAGQERQENLYINDSNQIFVKADSPIYFFVSPSGQPQNMIMLPSSDSLANPMYFDGDGKHYLVYQSNGQKVRYLVYADGFGPNPYIEVTSGLLMKHQNRIYLEPSASFTPKAKDKRSGVKSVYYSINNEPYKLATNELSPGSNGEFSLHIYAVDNVGNTSDTVAYTLISSPDVTFRVNNIYFETASATLLSESYEILSQMEDMLKLYPELHVEIKAHADTRGNPDYNLDLSERRAQSVVRYLLGKGISENRLKAVGFGDSKPVNECLKGVSCPDSKHRENRRVEFRFFIPKFMQPNTQTQLTK